MAKRVTIENYSIVWKEKSGKFQKIRKFPKNGRAPRASRAAHTHFFYFPDFSGIFRLDFFSVQYCMHCGFAVFFCLARSERCSWTTGVFPEQYSIVWKKNTRGFHKIWKKTQKWACAARFARGACPFLEFSRKILEFSGWIFFSVQYGNASSGRK